MTAQSSNPWRAGLPVRWRKPRAITSILAIAVLSGVVGGAWRRKADAGTPPAPDLAVVPLAEDFESAGLIFTSFSRCEDCSDFFHIVSTDAHSGTRSFYAADSPAAGANIAAGPVVVIPENAVAAELTFWQRFGFEQGGVSHYDGGVLEVQTGDDASDWIDAGPNMTAGGYNGSVTDRGGAGNPLEGRPAWVGVSDGWQQVTVDLMAYRGRRLAFRLQMGTDPSNASPVDGWWVDDFRVTYSAPSAACSRGWNALASLPGSVSQSGVTSVAGEIYAFGGLGADGATAVVSRYSPQNDRWSPSAALPEARLGASAVSDGRYIFILGGYDVRGEPPASTLWRYDPVANSYLTLAPMKTPSALNAAVYLDGIIYKIGGTTDPFGSVLTAAVEAYSVADNTWSAVADYPETIQSLAATTIDGYIYTAAGLNDGDASAKTYRYDPATDTWDDGPIADLPVAASFANGIFYNGTWIVSTFEETVLAGWDPRTNIWRSLDQPPARVEIAGLAVIDDAAYVVAPSRSSEDTLLQRYVEDNCACLGDCNGDGMVSISELVRGVGIALRTQPVSSCMAFDGNTDGNVAINELVSAVGNALHGCGV